MKTTNYYDTFIEIADDCPTRFSEMPPKRGDLKTAANLQFDLLIENPYEYTSDDILFSVYAMKNHISKTDLEGERKSFFTKGQACLRTSPLAKRYGWGIHHDGEGRVALYPFESKEYKKFSEDKKLSHVKAMRSSRSR